MESRFRGDQLIAFEGRCKACKKSERAYYVFADKRRQDMMKNGTFMGVTANCPPCVTSKVFQVSGTMEWKRRLPQEEVIKDLETLQYGINIDFDKADEEARTQKTKNDIADNFSNRSQELMEWSAKRH